jgi:hypothetical protein
VEGLGIEKCAVIENQTTISGEAVEAVGVILTFLK